MRSPLSLWRRFLARPNEDPAKVFGVAGLVALICAVVVSGTSIILKPAQQAHLDAERTARFERMIDTLPGLRDLMQQMGVDGLDTRLVDLSAGAFTTNADTGDFDHLAATLDPAQSIAIPKAADVARLGRRAKLAPIYLLENNDDLVLIVLPVSGAGYQSTLRAMLALEPDLVTIAALAITEQGETPGLGARIEDQDWQNLWAGKLVADESGKIVISTVRGQASGPYEVDGITGATITSNGVADMLRYWLGDHGYGPFLQNLRAGGL